MSALVSQAVDGLDPWAAQRRHSPSDGRAAVLVALANLRHAVTCAPRLAALVEYVDDITIAVVADMERSPQQ